MPRISPNGSQEAGRVHVMTHRIPFNRPLLPVQGLEYIRETFKNEHVSGDGPFTRRCQKALEELLGAKRVLLTTSCTDALELSALLLDVGAGEEVVVPSFTFVSTANAFVLRGAQPVFVDIRPDTFNLDESRLESAITSRTRAIVAMHYAGVGCEMDAISATARDHQIPLIEDNAHGLFGAFRGIPLGTFGSVAALSFHETKNLSCGEGGALVINDEKLASRAEILWHKGTDRSRFLRGDVDKYTWVDLGSSFPPSDVLAGLLWAQMEIRERIQAKRLEIHRRYSENLGPWARELGVGLPVIPSHVESSHHLFSLLMPTSQSQAALIRHLAGGGVQAVFHYQPLHLSPMGLRLGGRPGQCPVAESVARRIVRLPFYYDLTPDDQDKVIGLVRTFVP